MPLEVRLAPYVAAQLEELKAREARRPTSAEGVLYRGLRWAAQEYLPGQALNPSNKLKHFPEGLYAHRSGRVRILYAASKLGVRVLMIEMRKQGDRDDAYKAFKKALDRGDFAEQLTELGLGEP